MHANTTCRLIMMNRKLTNMKRPQGNIGVLIGRERNENTPENQGFAADLLAIANGLGWIALYFHHHAIPSSEL